MSQVEWARDEMKRAGFSGFETKDMTQILEAFFNAWDSGGAVEVMRPVLVRLLYGQPLSPLTGADDEWNDVSEASGGPMWQNKRCSTVFKTLDENGAPYAYDIDLPPEGSAGRKAWRTISFPYEPNNRNDNETTFVIETGDDDESRDI